MLEKETAPFLTPLPPTLPKNALPPLKPIRSMTTKLMQLLKQKTSYLGRVHQEQRSISTGPPNLPFSLALPQVAGQHDGAPALPRPLRTSNTRSHLDRRRPCATREELPGLPKHPPRLPRPWGQHPGRGTARAAWPGRLAGRCRDRATVARQDRPRLTLVTAASLIV